MHLILLKIITHESREDYARLPLLEKNPFLDFINASRQYQPGKMRMLTSPCAVKTFFRGCELRKCSRSRRCIEMQRRRGEREVTRTGSETEARKKVLARCFHFHGNCPRPLSPPPSSLFLFLSASIIRISYKSSSCASMSSPSE